MVTYITYCIFKYIALIISHTKYIYIYISYIIYQLYILCLSYPLCSIIRMCLLLYTLNWDHIISSISGAYHVYQIKNKLNLANRILNVLYCILYLISIAWFIANDIYICNICIYIYIYLICGLGLNTGWTNLNQEHFIIYVHWRITIKHQSLWSSTRSAWIAQTCRWKTPASITKDT